MIERDPELPFFVIDLGAIPVEQRRAEARRLAAAEAHWSYDLSRLPLFRTVLLRLGNDRSQLLFTLHHIISDGWSFGILFEELAATYGEGQTHAEYVAVEMVEPRNHPPVVRYSADCMAMADEVDSPNFKLSFDISGERAWQGTEWILQQAQNIGDRWAHSHYGGNFERNPDGIVERIPMGRTASHVIGFTDPKGGEHIRFRGFRTGAGNRAKR